VSANPPTIEDLLEPRQPSAIGRQESSLAASGISNAELARTRSAIASIGASLSPTAAPPTARDRLLASFARKGKFGIFADRVARLFDLSIADAEALMQKLEDPTAWMPFVVEGVEMIPIQAGPKCTGAIATLVKFRPGSSFPEHLHHGDETMLVLDGGFEEKGANHETRDEVWRGDECFSADGSEHSLVALEGTPCIAAVLIHGHADFK
jgi:anti-sigma factor ChrR (cupin superfamily)